MSKKKRFKKQGPLDIWFMKRQDVAFIPFETLKNCSSFFQPDNDDFNYCFLDQAERYINDLFQIEGRVILRDIYRCLGLNPWLAANIAYKYKGSNYIRFKIPGYYPGTEMYKEEKDETN